MNAEKYPSGRGHLSSCCDVALKTFWHPKAFMRAASEDMVLQVPYRAWTESRARSRSACLTLPKSTFLCPWWPKFHSRSLEQGGPFYEPPRSKAPYTLKPLSPRTLSPGGQVS